MEEKMKVLRVVIITLVVMILISCATTPKAQNVEIDRTEWAKEMIAEAITILVTDHIMNQPTIEPATGVLAETLNALGRAFGRDAEARIPELLARIDLLKAEAETAVSNAERTSQTIIIDAETRFSDILDRLRDGTCPIIDSIVIEDLKLNPIIRINPHASCLILADDHECCPKQESDN
jgi:hypothetical protein